MPNDLPGGDAILRETHVAGRYNASADAGELLRSLTIGHGALAEAMAFDDSRTESPEVLAWAKAAGVELAFVLQSVEVLVGRRIPPFIDVDGELSLRRVAAVVAASPPECEHALVRWAGRVVWAATHGSPASLGNLTSEASRSRRRDPVAWRALWRRTLNAAEVEARIGICESLALGLNSWQLEAMWRLDERSLAAALDLARKGRLTATSLRGRGSRTRPHRSV